METRAELLQQLIRNAGTSEALRMKLNRFVWDCDHHLAVLEPVDVQRVLAEFEAGSLSAAAVTAWAETIESRDDIGYADGDRGALADVLFWLASPEINGRVDAALCRRIEARLVPAHG